MDESAMPAVQRRSMALPYVLSLAHALVLRRISDDPDNDATTLSSALGWPVAVIEELLGDLERQGMIAPSRKSGARGRD